MNWCQSRVDTFPTQEEWIELQKSAVLVAQPAATSNEAK
jgi:hypothetical protein